MLNLVAGRPGRLAAQAAVLSAVVGASLLYSSLDKTVTLSVDGKTSEVHGFSRTVGDLLDDQGLEVGPRDIVAPKPSSSLGENQTVVVKYARPLTVTVDGAQQTYWTTETSVDQALRALGIRAAEGAQLSASRSARIDRAGLTMWMSSPKKITLIEGGKKQKLTTTAPTVGALLTEQNLKLNELDKLSQVDSTILREGAVVKLTRISKKTVEKRQKIAFKVTKRSSSKLYKGTTKIVRKGKAGLRDATYTLTVTDGKITKRKLVKATVVRKPVTQIVEVGTKKKPSSSSGGGGGTPSGGGLNWAALAKCESGGNPRAVNPAGYYGLYQFSLSTWRAQGGSGNPIDASSAEQTRRAQILYGKTGASSWPHCGPKLFT